MGPKGHTFVVVPYKSESYSNQVEMNICLNKNNSLLFFCLKSDPIDKDVPYCNVKSFPANIEHCTIWAREKVKFKKKEFLINNFLLI
jgi:ubiquitin-activating enzyme E1-like protein 2